MSNEIIPILNAQQQGMATTISNIATRPEVMSQVSQYVSAQIVEDENKKLDKVAEDESSPSVSREGKENNSFQAPPKQEHKKDKNVITCPSYHNPLSGKLLNTKV